MAGMIEHQHAESDGNDIGKPHSDHRGIFPGFAKNPASRQHHIINEKEENSNADSERAFAGSGLNSQRDGQKSQSNTGEWQCKLFMKFKKRLIIP